MNSKGRVTALKHRATKQKRQKQRVLARQLLKGELTTDQVRLLVGDGYSGVLKTADYIVNKEGSTIPSYLASDIAMAVSPAIHNSWGTTGGKPVNNTQKRTPKIQTTTKNELADAISTEKLSEQEVPTSDQSKPTRIRKTKTASKKETLDKAEDGEEKPKRKTTAKRKTASTKSKNETE
jgi:hypothetical protein